MKSRYINEIKAKETVDDEIFFVKSVKLLDFKNKPGQYLSLFLSDKGGNIGAKMWDADEKGKMLAEKTFIKCHGEVVEFANVLEIHIDSWIFVSQAEIDPADFLPLTPYDIKEMQNEVINIASGISNQYLKALLNELIDDKGLFARYSNAPAAKAIHQAYIGGLLEHSLKTAKITGLISDLYPAVNKELAITGALLHDIGKIKEYEVEYSIEVSDEGRLLGHIIMGLDILNALINKVPGFPDELRVALQHIITSHHGRYEWQSPKKPKTLESLLIHYSDAIEADLWKFTDLKEKYKGSRWSPWDRSLERYVFVE